MIRDILIGALLAVSVSGCDVYQETYDATFKQRVAAEGAALIVTEAPTDAVLLVDGETIGRADRYDDSASALALEEGDHTIEVQLGAETIFRQAMFLPTGKATTINLTKQSP